MEYSKEKQVLHTINTLLAGKKYKEALMMAKEQDLKTMPAEMQPYYIEVEIRILMILLQFENALLMINTALKFMPNLRIFHMKKIECLVNLGRQDEANSAMSVLKEKLQEINESSTEGEIEEKKTLMHRMKFLEDRYRSLKDRDITEIRVWVKKDTLSSDPKNPKYEMIKKGLIFTQDSEKVYVTIANIPKVPESISPIFAVLNFEIAFEDIRGEIFSCNLDLFAEIDPTKSTFSINEQKQVVLELAKFETGKEWPSLISSRVESQATGKQAGLTNTKKNWEQLCDDFEEDEARLKQSGEDPAMALFRQIYKNADPEKRKAMIKSYQTSGGTVL